MSEAQRMPFNGSFNYGGGGGAISATRSAIDEFCYALGGNRPIHSVLIANNGMAAVKFITSVRTWSYETFGSEKAILLVAMATPEDMRINAEHIRIADQFVEVPGGTNNNNYANVQLIVETAEITHVDAVWPGWGHASEIPELPDALEAKGIIFLGPPALSMSALGDKIGSSLIAQAADVPTLPWSGSHVKVPVESCLGTIPDDVYRKACVYTTEEAIASCQVVGYPAMIKASWGGGGKGIRKVHNDEEVKALFKQVQGEVPGSPIFIMKVASQSRHLEVQLLCDQYGNVAALHSRDCSVQRRHQKIIEEGPITVAPPDTIKKLEQAARRLAKLVNYVGAATVEYLYSMETGDYYFLELNPRLQVEHPVTEWIAEVNLPAAQVAVGMGIPLWQIPEIRRLYGMNNSGGYDAWRKTSVLATPFDFDKAESVRPKGHCVAVRVTSEDPDDGFKPTSGKVQSGGGIHEFSDSQFGHVFAFGESRTLAIANMVLGLKEIQIRGEIRTNVDYTIDLLHAPDYRENKIHTGWLDGRIAMRVRAERPPWYLSVVGGALYKAAARSAAMVSDYVGYLEKGQIPPKHISLVNSQVILNIEGSRYTIDMVKRGPGSYTLRMNQSEIEAEIHTLRDGGLLMQNDHDPSKLVAETPCKLLRYLVSDGSHVDADLPYAEVEVMKMCMPLLSPASGVIQFKMSEGQAMQAGELIARLDLDDPSALESKFKEYEGISIQQAIEFPAKVLRGILETHLGSCSEKEKVAQERLIEPLMSLVKSYEGGRESHARRIVHSLFEEYLSVEELFSDNIQADVIERLRLHYMKDLLRVVDIVLSHQGVRSKNKLILRLMEHLVYPNPAAYREKLIQFSALNHTNYSEDKLKGYENIKYTPSRDRQWHMYTVDAKPLPFQRMFLRTLVRQPTKEWFSPSGYQGSEVAGPRSQLALSYTSRSILRSLVTAMEELELHVHNATVKSDHAHMYLYVLKEQQIHDLVLFSKNVDVDEEGVLEELLVKLAREIHSMVGVKMHRLGVFEWEIKLCMASSGEVNGAWRVVVTNVTGHTCIVHVYREIEDKVVYHSTSALGPLHGVPVNTPSEPLKLLDKKRLLARKSNTTYCYDFVLAFEAALENIWSSVLPNNGRPECKLVKATELMFADPGGSWGTPLVPVNREPGQNNVGMVAWTMDLCTPEFPNGRTILVVANDVTFKNGSFGPIEDAFFEAVTNLGCTKKLPLIYLAANSGARIGAAEEVRSCFRIGWSDESNPDSGFQYLYLTPEDYTRIKSSVIAHEITLESGEKRWVIDTIVGKEDGLGVENLSGSGAIAGAYSKAYKQTFTLTYVTGRTVGIGAYLARLGMRCIQRVDQPIILTGFSALNKLLGREVYSSQMQLGGPKIMGTNGVVHLTVSDDLEGVLSILNWLSFVPPYVGGPLPVLAPVDPVDRPVEYLPENSCDPRAAVCGMVDGKWVGGIFDRDSFVETLEGWARTVVTGRAKLGGIPVGVIAVETQTVMQIIPADPGQLDSHERVVPQAGQVWFPDSASKTAQAIMDFNREELPLFIMANWRGFSAGQRDLFEGILQAGSTIVENLRTYNQPVFVYIPKTGELRGGAWVVVDSRINSDHIEMYAETTAKGNVLEPEGMIEIKFRNKELLDCMARLDPQLQNLKEKLKESKYDQIVANQIKAREKQLLPIYTQMATKFAELHDTSFRMAEKGVVKKVVDWKVSRFFFYKRLRRRLAEACLISSTRDAAGDAISYKSAYDMIRKWFLETKSEELWVDDDEFFTWKDDPKNYTDKLNELRKQKVSNQLLKMDLEALPQGLAAVLQQVDQATKSKLIQQLGAVVDCTL
ncbi:hypothetical protein L1987_76415 [Smallanthus sonchifolius]|uniref:Uncharacterized protein n=1 Tax=Smallanthus sonchifolius TaxID=185202 RepID=A0ACB9A7Q2_9ASTR|nr:hypothetical protein L1987_76415 [Smallanthus sonchifolius]